VRRKHCRQYQTWRIGSLAYKTGVSINGSQQGVKWYLRRSWQYEAWRRRKHQLCLCEENDVIEPGVAALHVVEEYWLLNLNPAADMTFENGAVCAVRAIWHLAC